MITVAMSTVIDAERARVWRALTESEERARWDDALLAPVPSGVTGSLREPASGARDAEPGWLQWRYRLGSVQTVMRERVLELRPGERLKSEVVIGSFSYTRTFDLMDEPGETGRTRLAMKLVSSSAIPLVGDVVDRFEVRKLVSERIDSTLRAVQRWCEPA